MGKSEKTFLEHFCTTEPFTLSHEFLNICNRYRLDLLTLSISFKVQLGPVGVQQIAFIESFGVRYDAKIKGLSYASRICGQV